MSRGLSRGARAGWAVSSQPVCVRVCAHVSVRPQELFPCDTGIGHQQGAEGLKGSSPWGPQQGSQLCPPLLSEVLVCPQAGSSPSSQQVVGTWAVLCHREGLDPCPPPPKHPHVGRPPGAEASEGGLSSEALRRDVAGSSNLHCDLHRRHQAPRAGHAGGAQRSLPGPRSQAPWIRLSGSQQLQGLESLPGTARRSQQWVFGGRSAAFCWSGTLAAVSSTTPLWARSGQGAQLSRVLGTLGPGGGYGTLWNSGRPPRTGVRRVTGLQVPAMCRRCSSCLGPHWRPADRRRGRSAWAIGSREARMRSAPVPGSAFPRAAFLTEKVVGPETLSRPRGALGNVHHEGAGAPRAWGCLPLCGSGGDTLRGRSALALIRVGGRP